MGLEKFREVLAKYEIKKDYCFGGSALLDAFELREVKGLDILVSEKDFERLKTVNKLKLGRGRRGNLMLSDGDVTFFTDVGYGNATSKYLVCGISMGGINFPSFENFIIWKAMRGRKKDFEDIILVAKQALKDFK